QGAEQGKVAFDVLAYNQHDWCYTGGLFTFDPARLYEAFDAHARSLIDQLPPPLLIARRTSRWLMPFNAAQRDRRRLVEAILHTARSHDPKASGRHARPLAPTPGGQPAAYDMESPDRVSAVSTSSLTHGSDLPSVHW